MKKKEFKIAKHSTTNEDYQLVKELLPHCRETIGVDFFDSAGNLQLSLTQSGRIISKAIILTVKLTRHHYRDWIEEKINLLFIKQDGESIEVHNLSRSNLSAKNLEQILGFSSGLYFSPILDDIILPLVEEQLCFKGRHPVPIEDKYHFSGRDPEKVQYVCRDGTLLAPLNSITPEDLIKVPDRVSIFKLLDYLIRVAPNYIAIYILALRALASMLSSPALEGKLKPSFGIILLGETGSKKTSLVKALFYMDEHPYNAVNFKWTPAAVQEKLKDVQDDIVFADDMYPAKITSEKNQQREMLSLLIRATGDTIGSRQKMQGGTVTTGKASSLFIATAEQLIPCSESDIWRTIIFNIPKGDVDLEALTWLQEHPDVLRTPNKTEKRSKRQQGRKKPNGYQPCVHIGRAGACIDGTRQRFAQQPSGAFQDERNCPPHVWQCGALYVSLCTPVCKTENRTLYQREVSEDDKWVSRANFAGTADDPAYIPAFYNHSHWRQ